MIEPPWLKHARGLIGTREVQGAADDPRIMAWAGRLGAKVLGIAYPEDSTPWCGLFVAHCFAATGIVPAPIAVRASSWAGWGLNLRPERLVPGTVLVFSRRGGGHVGFYMGEDAETYAVLGGNQNDSVCVANIGKARCVARRWPEGQPVIGSDVRHTGASSVNGAREA